MPLIETRKLTDESIDYINSLTPKELEDKYKNGDFLYLMGIAFQIVFYSLESLKDGQSTEVTYWSEYYNLEINLNWNDDTVEAIAPLIDWKRSGF